MGAEKITLECQRQNEVQPNFCVLKSVALLRRQTISALVNEVNAKLEKSVYLKTGIVNYKAVLSRQSSRFVIDCGGGRVRVRRWRSPELITSIIL
ncbi:MAG: hypothetical protein WBB82_02905 [Limnothrix sp.]